MKSLTGNSQQFLIYVTIKNHHFIDLEKELAEMTFKAELRMETLQPEDINFSED